MSFIDLLLLATEGVEGVSPDHIASKLAVPIAILIFGGAAFALLWSNYGWRKGALIYGVATFGFFGVIGVFWWFGAPGTPVATGLQNFPGQTADEYQPKWFPFEADSPRAQAFSLWESFEGIDDPGEFQTVAEFTGTTDVEDPMFSNISGDLDSVSQLMIAQYMPRSPSGALQIGASLRQTLTEATPPAPAGERFVDWVTDVAEDENGDKEYRIAIDNGQRVAATDLVTYAVYEDAETGLVTTREPILAQQWFAFKDPGSLWLPSAVWTLVSFLLFAICLFFLDRIEQREKREAVVVEEAMDVQVPIAQ